MRVSALVGVLAISLLAAACNNESSKTEASAKAESKPEQAQGEIRLADFPKSTDYPDAQLGISGMTATKVGDSVKLSMTFNVKNYELKAQTPDSNGKLCNSSAQGQHIHFILDNRPYVALYEPKHETTVPLNSEHYILCFLSRSYHESVKSREAAVLAHIKIDEKGNLQRLPDEKAPMLFYSRPKGDYLGKDTANLLLDFYPVNVALGSQHRIKADIRNETSGKTASFTLNEWKPSFIQGLGSGKASVTLTLIDKDGKAVEGPFSAVTRNINLAASEPLK